MKLKLLSEQPYLKVSLEQDRNWIYADWTGYQTVGSVQDGCERVLEQMVRHAAFHVINDNTRVQGIWSGASTWVARDWFPRMRSAGMHRFAWIYSPARFSRISADTSLAELGEAVPYIRVFEDMDGARVWLQDREMPAAQLRDWAEKAKGRGAPETVISLVVDGQWNPLRAWREHLGITQAAAAAQLRLSQVEYAAREAIMSSPPPEELEALANLFGLPPELLTLDCNRPAFITAC